MATATLPEKCPACQRQFAPVQRGTHWACECGYELTDNDAAQRELNAGLAERRQREQAAADAEAAREKKVATDAADARRRETVDGVFLEAVLPARADGEFVVHLTLNTRFPVSDILKAAADACRQPLHLAREDFKKRNEDYLSLAKLSAQVSTLKTDLSKATVSLTALKEKYEHELCAGGDKLERLERDQAKLSDEVQRYGARLTTLSRVLEESRSRALSGWEKRHAAVIVELRHTAQERLIAAKAGFLGRGAAAGLRELLIAQHFLDETVFHAFRFPLGLD